MAHEAALKLVVRGTFIEALPPPGLPDSRPRSMPARCKVASETGRNWEKLLGWEELYLDTLQERAAQLSAVGDNLKGVYSFDQEQATQLGSASNNSKGAYNFDRDIFELPASQLHLTWLPNHPTDIEIQCPLETDLKVGLPGWNLWGNDGPDHWFPNAKLGAPTSLAELPGSRQRTWNFSQDVADDAGGLCGKQPQPPAKSRCASPSSNASTHAVDVLPYTSEMSMTGGTTLSLESVGYESDEELQAAADQVLQEDDVVTTLMICNLPCRVTHEELERNNSNRGYAFINLLTVEDARRCIEIFDGYRFRHMGSKKVCSVKPARLQGFSANKRQFATTRRAAARCALTVEAATAAHGGSWGSAPALRSGARAAPARAWRWH
mmetsp:Transcript_69424/g.192084  ORF Transcript_69424/g.192084 Transcript_69424/m.192084 type:complete len:380 (-) Transcript_69424:207-1346(-)